jgi:hypothetical protein
VVWTGTTMIVYGGSDSGGFVTGGGIYDAEADSWTEILGDIDGAPGAKASHTAVWTGTEMVTFGGSVDGFVPVSSDGSSYEPSGDAWTPLTASADAEGRTLHTAVWTGTSMIVFGGLGISSSAITGGAIWTP